jgi:hypothetical protein
MYHHHHYHQEVLLLYQSYVAVKIIPSARAFEVLKAYRYQVYNTVVSNHNLVTLLNTKRTLIYINHSVRTAQ